MRKIYEKSHSQNESSILFKLSFCDFYKEPSTRMFPRYVQRDAWSGWTLLVHGQQDFGALGKPHPECALSGTNFSQDLPRLCELHIS